MSDPQANKTLLHCTGLDIRIGAITVTRQLDLTIEKGECWCILGRNGTGKTTLLHTLAGLRQPDSGTIYLDDRPLQSLTRKQIARKVGVLFQDHDDPFPATVLETVLQGRHPHLHPWQWETDDDNDRARQALSLVELDTLEKRNIQTLSGGERRRAGVATLFAQDPELLLLDEPTNHLDLRHRITVLQQLVEWSRQHGKAVCMILHDLNLAARLADQVLLIFGEGEILHGSATEILQTGNLERLYGYPLTCVETPAGKAWLPA